MRTLTMAALSSVLGLLVAGCDAGVDATTTTEATPDAGAITEHEVVFRQPGTEGDVAYILIDREHTEEGLHDLARRLMADDPGLWGLEVFDSPEAVDAGLSQLLSAADLALLQEHHLLSVIARDLVRFQGPYADLGERSMNG